MDYRVEAGKTLTLTDPETGESDAVRMMASEDGKATITVAAPPDVWVSKVRGPQQSPDTIH
jgi:hypothetical protein